MDYNTLHQALLGLHKLASWRWWKVTSLLVLLAVVLGGLGWWATGGFGLGLFYVLIFLAFVGLDAALLAALPRLGLSFGPVQPPLVSLAIVRWLIGLLGLALSWWTRALWPSGALIGVQVLILELAVYGCVIEPRQLTLTRLNVDSPKLAPLTRPLTVLHLSDLHMERPTGREERVLELARDLAPDLILLTGDYLNLSYTDDDLAVQHAHDWLQRLEAPLGVYAVLGTAEVDLRERADELFDGTGVHLLRDETVFLDVDGASLALIGITCDRDLERDVAALTRAAEELEPTALAVLLYHTPDLMPEAAEKQIDLYLAGHTHGGQWRLPGFGALITSSVYGKRYEMGSYREGRTRLYVSRGLGLEGLAAPRARFLCPPELVLLSLSASQSTVEEDLP